ncbi:MAG: pyruvate, phosphate dikinase [Paracoccaceae bacterium]|nr:pyruvate, phosphate dikinase [Paracoccaceae bacterium]
MTRAAEIGWIGAKVGSGAQPLDPAAFGAKAAWLSRAAELGLPVPPGFAVPASMTADPAGAGDALAAALTELEAKAGARLGDTQNPLLISVRGSAPGGIGAPPTILNIGVCETTLPGLARLYGGHVAQSLYRRLLQSYGAGALGIEGDEFEYALFDAIKYAGAETEDELSAENLEELTRTCLRLIEDEGESFPQDPRDQLMGALGALAGAWSNPRARMLRAANGQDEEAGLPLIVQAMVMGLGAEPSGAGIAHPRDEVTGARQMNGRYLTAAQGEEALMGLRTPTVLTRAEREAEGLSEPSLEELCPDAVTCLTQASDKLEEAFGETFTLEFTLSRGETQILEAKPARRSARAALRIAVELAERGAISRDEALLRIDPSFLEDHLHPSICPDAVRDLIGQGLPASPGAVSGPLVFSPDIAEAEAAGGRPAILALIETSPEDIRGMHAALGVLTVRGGMTSHAAVVARGLGRPCVVGAKDLELDRRENVLRARDGRVFRAGDVVTVDGSEGQVLAGAVETVPPEISGAFATLMKWADEARRMGVRANADTAADATMARGFNAEGIGLCRTEHMFFQRGRISAMRQVIMAESATVRRKALETLLPMQRGDFIDLFEAMAGLPVVIRLLDPPLHEFLPHGEAEMAEMANSLDVPISKVKARAQDLAEFNPMLGKRGCRIGIAYPEIYQMQARAIFEAACEAATRTGQAVRPEIMIPLVSAVRELELLKRHIDEVAEEVRGERDRMVDYHVGVMIETPRAALRANDIADEADFISFGTNDLTQMVYGLSRDDAGRFIPEYLAQQVYHHDPFHTLDMEGVGEIIQIATERARASRPEISIGLCGEHGADPASVGFCEESGFDYVSCSPFRVPIARLAAAQAAIKGRG